MVQEAGEKGPYDAELTLGEYRVGMLPRRSMSEGQEANAVNGAAPNRINHQLVTLLRKTLQDAEAGRIVAGGVVVVPGPSAFLAFSVFGNFPAEVIAGCFSMQSSVNAAVNQKLPVPGAQLLRASPPIPHR